MTWIWWNTLGATSLALCNSFFRANPLNLSWVMLLIVMIPLTTLGTQLGFMMAYRGAPTFFQAWFVGSAFSALTGWLAAVFVFNEHLHFLHVLGIILIGGGTYCLIK